MSVANLKEALKNCLVNFDRRVMLTELLQEYELNYAEVNKILEEYIRQQESTGVKYEKRFLVQGVEKDSNDEVHTVVNGEQKMQDWLQRLRNAEATLYSIEVAGGAKSPAYAFTPVEQHRIKLNSLVVRETAVQLQISNSNSTTNSSNGVAVKAENKPEVKKPSGMDMFAKKTSSGAGTSNKHKTSEKPTKVSPEAKKSSPEDKKTKPAPSKKGIGNFFTVATKSENKKEEHKPELTKKNIENTSDKKVENRTANKTENTTDRITKNIKKEANTSVQLFEEESDQSSSDDEDKLEALRRDVITSDHEDEDEDDKAASTSKRRRIIDSDEEEEAAEEPQKKIEKKDTVDITEDETPQQQSETYLDDEGFVITIKPKKGSAKNSKPPVPPKVSPTRKSPVKAAAAKTSAKPATTKGKQGNIMNFFSKK